MSKTVSESPPVSVSALLLGNGLRWACASAETLSSCAWAVLPGVTGLDDDRRVAAQLHADLMRIDLWVR
jgi:hypothetical protein